MQALNNAPLDLQTKDKFLVETTVVPFGTADEGIVPAFVSICSKLCLAYVIFLCICLYFTLTQSSL